MISDSHLDLGEPMKIQAFGCPQCLCLFNEADACQTHMRKEKHLQYLYPFPEDMSRPPLHSRPVPFPLSIMEEFVKKCKVVSWSLECIECGQRILTSEDYLVHRQKPQCQQQMIMAIADSSPVSSDNQICIKHQYCTVLYA